MQVGDISGVIYRAKTFSRKNQLEGAIKIIARASAMKDKIMKKLFLSAVFVLLVSAISVSAQSAAMDPIAWLKNMPNLSTQVFNGMFADLVQQQKGAKKPQNKNVGTNNQNATLKNQPSTVVNPAANKITAGKTTFTPTGS